MPQRDANGAMDYRILGRLEVVEGQQLLPLGGSRQRALLAMLLLNRRQVVSVARFERAIDRLGAAVALCPERPLEEFLDEPFARAEIERLTEARLAALEDHIEGELRAGGGPELVAELERSVADHPLRERLIADVMLALYRAGRHSDALAAYRAARTRVRAPTEAQSGGATAARTSAPTKTARRPTHRDHDR